MIHNYIHACCYIMAIQYDNNIVQKDDSVVGLHPAGQGSSVRCSANVLYSQRLQNEGKCITKQNMLLMKLCKY